MDHRSCKSTCVPLLFLSCRFSTFFFARVQDFVDHFFVSFQAFPTIEGTVIWKIFVVKNFLSKQTLRKLNTRNILNKKHVNYELSKQHFCYYNSPILLHWLFPIWRYEHGSFECSKVLTATPW